MSIVKAASSIVLLTLIGRLLGFFRNMYVFDLYGTGMEADAYFTALTIPMTLFLVIPGAINAVLIPTMRGMLEKAAKGEVAALYKKMLAIVLLAFFILSLAGVVFSKQIALLIGMTGAKAELTASLLQWMWPSVLFIGLAGLWSSVCNAHQHFFTPTLGTVVNSAVVIIAMYMLVPFWGVTGIAIATTIGFITAALPMLPTLKRLGYQHTFAFGFREDEALRSMGERVIPILIGAVISQATTFLERGFAAGLGDGKIAALAYANQIAQLPMAVFVGAFTLPLFPLLASYVKRGELEQMKLILQKGLSYLLIILIPITVGLIVYGEPIIRLVYARHSSPGDVALQWTAWGLAFYAVGLYGLAARDLLTRAFYALENTRTPVTIGVFGIVVYIATAYAATPLLGHGGVALSASVSAFVQSSLLFILLWRKVGNPLRLPFVLTLLKVAVASGLMGLMLALAEPYLATLGIWLEVGIGVSAAMLLYAVVLVLLKEPLLSELLDKVRRRGGSRMPGS